jgi:electron transport complex protein RnfC
MAISFKGGIRLKGYNSAAICESRPIMPCPEHIYPLTDSFGVTYTPVVKAGDKIKLGQKIAEADNGVYSPLHSSVSGSVKAIEDHVVESGESVRSVIIENDRLYDPIEAHGISDDYTLFSPKRLTDIICELGADGFSKESILAQIRDLDGRAPKFLVINAVESEPYSAAVYRRIVENTEDVINGIHILQYILGAKNASVGVQAKKREAVNALMGASRYDESINIIQLGSKYPQEDTRLFIKAVTGRSAPIGKRPTDIGCVIADIETVYNISRVLKTGMPVTDRIITVAGESLSSPDNMIVPFGVPISFLIGQLFSLKADPDKTIVGSPMTGTLLDSTDVPTTKTTSAVYTKQSSVPKKNTNKSCIHCGHCVSHCPMRLMPFRLSNASLSYRPSVAMKYHILSCIQCGTCTYVCPAGRNLADEIGSMRQTVLSIYGKEKTNE